MHFKDAKGILSPHNGMNIYRGCTHGCIYCDSRSVCYQMGHDFEDVQVKANAPALLEAALRKKREKCMISTGSMCDSYIAAEQELRHTRKCLEIIEKYGFGLSILTKSDLILRDMDVLSAINKKARCVVQMTLTTYDEDLCRLIEPNVSTTAERFRALKAFRDAGIPTVVWLCPILPFINDTADNMHGLLNYCIEAGAKGVLAWGAGVTLREGSREYFYQKLDENFPGLSKKYHHKYGYAYGIRSDNNTEIKHMITQTCRKNGIIYGRHEVFKYISHFPQEHDEQIGLF